MYLCPVTSVCIPYPYTGSMPCVLEFHIPYMLHPLKHYCFHCTEIAQLHFYIIINSSISIHNEGWTPCFIVAWVPFWISIIKNVNLPQILPMKNKMAPSLVSILFYINELCCCNECILCYNVCRLVMEHNLYNLKSLTVLSTLLFNHKSG